MDPHAEDREKLMGKHPDNVYAEHYKKAIEELKQAENSNGVARGAIAMALAHASMSRSNDPTLRHMESILRAHQDALDDHFKLSQQSGDVRF
jgi:hypothetical protein